MRLIRLQAKDVLRLEAVDITPEGNLCIIGGQNAQGKSSVLTAIACALAGKSAFPDVPVRRGKKTAEIVVDMGDLIVTRQIDAKGTTRLVVAGPDGAPKRSPQSILDALVGRLTFDPLEFSRMPPKAQAETLRELMGLDFTKRDEDRAEAYDRRTTINRDLKSAKARLDAIEDYPSDTPDEVPDIDALHDEAQRVDVHNMEIQQRTKKLDASRAEAFALQAKIVEAQRQVKAMEDELEIMVENGKKLAKAVGTDKPIDVAPFRQKLREHGRVRDAVRRKQAFKALCKEIKDAEAQAENYTKQIEAADADKAAMIAAAEMPVPGLAFDETGVMLNGLPFSQASDAEKLRTSIAMGFAANPKLRILLIRDGSLLDDESLKLVAEMADERDGQIFMERVGDGPECQIVIEDGAVVGERDLDAEDLDLKMGG